MGKFIKKASAIILSAAGIFLAAPSAFCFPPKVGNEKGDNCVPCFNFRVINPEEKLNFCLPREVYLAENRRYGRFVATFPKGIKRMVYFPHSFNKADFRRVLKENKIIDLKGNYTEQWERYLEINGVDTINGCHVIFVSGNKEIVFYFEPGDRENFNTLKSYNKFMKHYGFSEASVLLPGEIEE